MTAAVIRVVDLETGGNGTDDVCEIGWQDVRQGIDGVWRIEHEGGALLVNPGRPMSPDTLAVHHILDSQVASAPFWKAVAPTVLRPEGGLVALAAHRAAFEQRYCRPALSGGVEWICTWKCALRLWPTLSRFSNQMLRYLRRPEGLVHQRGLPAHRARTRRLRHRSPSARHAERKQCGATARLEPRAGTASTRALRADARPTVVRA